MRFSSRGSDRERVRCQPRVLGLHSRVYTAVVSHQILRSCHQAHRSVPSDIARTFQRDRKSCFPKAASTRARRFELDESNSLHSVLVSHVWASSSEEDSACSKPTCRGGLALLLSRSSVRVCVDSRVVHTLTLCKGIHAGRNPRLSPLLHHAPKLVVVEPSDRDAIGNRNHRAASGSSPTG